MELGNVPYERQVIDGAARDWMIAGLLYLPGKENFIRVQKGARTWNNSHVDEGKDAWQYR